MNTAFREVKKSIQLSATGNPNFPPHLHEAVEIIYMKHGQGIAYCNGEAYTLTAGDFFLVFPNQIHYYSHFGPESDSMLLTANPAFFPAYTQVFSEKTPFSPQYTSGEEDRNLLRVFQIAFEEHAKNAPKDVVVSILSAALSMLLERYALTDINTGHSCAHRLLHYCKKHYKEELTVERISQELHISRSHISHTFNDHFKISFPDYINSLRLADAVRLLDKGTYSITEVAQQAGFPTIRTFNRAFLKHFGLSPRQFLQEKQR